MTAPIGRDEAIRQIRALLGPAGIVDDPQAIEPHLTERRGLWHGQAALIARPDSTASVAATVAICAAARLPMVAQGGNTGLCGGGVPDVGAVVIDLTRLNRIRRIDPANHTMIAEAGCILANVQAAADAADLLFPLSLGAEGSCVIGGNVSTNAGGVQVLRWGNMRDLVLGLEVVLPDGRVWDGLRTLRKDNTGYDLKHLFIGAEGTLGIVTAAALKLFPKPRRMATAFVGLAGLDAVLPVLARARAAGGDLLTACELIPRIALDFACCHIEGVTDPLAQAFDFAVLLELSSPSTSADLDSCLEQLLETCLADGLIGDATIARSAAQRAALWRIREGLVEAQKFEGGSIKHDVSVPVASVPDFIEAASAAVKARLPGIRPIPFGHIGDGNIHFNLTQPEGADTPEYLARWREFNEIVHPIVASFGGSISAEHGLGRLKNNEIARYKAPLELELMARIKRAFDPDGLMNPGKVLPDAVLD